MPPDHADEPRAATLLDRDGVLRHLDDMGARAQHAVLLLVDLDRFRDLNAAVGRVAADAALDQVGARLLDAVHPGDVVGCLGGDEFLVVCRHGVVDAEAVARDLRAATRTALPHLGAGAPPDASIGLAVHDGRSSTLRNLAAANVALRVAKERGGGRVEMFDDGLREVAIRTLTRTAELRQAAAAGHLRLHFQPIVDLLTGTMLGCEGLLRWEHPTRGVVPPAEFLDVAETSGLLDELTGELVEQAAVAARQLATQSPEQRPYVALNLNARQLTLPRLLPAVRAALSTNALAPGQLAVEITETSVLTDMERALESLHGLNALGVAVSLDDFGTGYSSLLHLKRLPVAAVKIDRSFVSGIMRGRSDLSIVAGVIDLALRLGLRTVAEGVETQEQARALLDLGCDAGQGFLWSSAMPLDALPPLPAPPACPQRCGDADRRTRAQIMRMHADGASVHTIAAALNADGLRTARGRRWQARSVAAVLETARLPVHARSGR